jgi:hypothetical protein
LEKTVPLKPPSRPTAEKKARHMESQPLDAEPLEPAPGGVPGLQFETSPYQSDGGWTASGALFTLLTVTTAGFMIGWAVSFISQWMYFVLLFPAGMGLILGVAGNWAVHRGKVRSAQGAGLIALLGAAMVIGTMHYMQYRQFLQAVPIIQNRLSFVDYMDLRATQGVTLTSGHGRHGGINLGYTGSFIYWGVELLAVAFIAMAIMATAAKSPFCNACQSWKAARLLGRVQVPMAAGIEAVRAGTIASLADHNLAPGSGPLEFTVAVCPNCGHESSVDVKLQAVSKNKKGEEVKKELAHVTYPGEALAVWEALFKPSAPVERSNSSEPTP